MSVGGMLRAARREKGWTLEELEWQSGVSQAAAGGLERGRSTGTFRTVVALARHLGVSLDDLAAELEAAGAHARNGAAR